MNFSAIRALVFDMDGVLWRGDDALPGLVELFTFLAERDLPFCLATNNSRRTQADYVARLARMGVQGVDEKRILTSGLATAIYLQGIYPPGTRLHVVGGSGLRHELETRGFVLADEDVQAVIVGIDTDFTYAKARRASRLLMAGAAFIATNADRSVPLEDGLAPGAGSIIAMLQTASDSVPMIIGKPNAAMFEAALRQLGTNASETLMVGDRLTTDIEGAYRAGLRSALVLTGVNTREEALAYAVQPDVMVDDLHDLMRRWG